MAVGGMTTALSGVGACEPGSSVMLSTVGVGGAVGSAVLVAVGEASGETCCWLVSEVCPAAAFAPSCDVAIVSTFSIAVTSSAPGVVNGLIETGVADGVAVGGAGVVGAMTTVGASVAVAGGPAGLIGVTTIGVTLAVGIMATVVVGVRLAGVRVGVAPKPGVGVTLGP